MSMRRLSRRDFATSVGAGLVLAPFVSMLGGQREAHAATRKAKRLLLFCTAGTYPPVWTPTSLSGETINTFARSTEALAMIKDSIVMVEGMPTINVNGSHGDPSAITGLDHGYYNGQLKISVDQFVADKLVASGVNRPISSLLLGAETNVSGSHSMFYGGSKNGGNALPTIASPLSAFTTVFGGALPTGTSADALLRRRRSILDTIKAETTALQGTLGNAERAKLDLHLTSIRQLENKLGTAMPTGASCTKPATPGADSTFTYMSTMDVLASAKVHQDIIANAFACDITRVAAIQFGNDQKMMVNLPGRLPYDDQHGGFVHSGASTQFKNLIELERYLAEQFVALVMALKARPDPEDGSKSLFDTTIVAWCRDMGNAVDHDQKSMRFVLASGNNGGYLKTAAGGRYLMSTQRHERILLNLCEAMGVTDFRGFGDPGLSSKTPLPNVAATV
jgi:hypothetical protein